MVFSAVLAMFDLPAAPTAGGVGVVLVVVLYRLIVDRNAFHSQIEDLQKEVGDLRTHVDNLDQKYQEERSLKHKSRNDVARSVMALELVRRLAKDCTCGVLAPLTEIIDRLFSELETVHTNAEHHWPPLEET